MINLKDYSLTMPDIDPVSADTHTFTSLESVDLTTEILTQLTYAIRLRNATALDPDIPANQKAQVNNSCASLILQLTKAQTDLYASDRLKKQEACLIKCLKTLPDATTEAFLKAYAEELKNV